MTSLIPDFNEFYASIEEQKIPRELLYVHYNGNDEVSEDTRKNIADWMPVIGRKCTVIASSTEDYCVEIPKEFWHTRVRDVLNNARFKPHEQNKLELNAEGNFSEVRFPEYEGQIKHWFVESWVMKKNDVSAMRINDRYKEGVFSGKLNKSDKLILDHVSWSNGMKKFQTIFGWRVYKKNK